MITLTQLPGNHPGRRFLTGDTTWFATQADQRFSYGLRVPERFVPGTRCPVVVAVHSTMRRAQELRRSWSDFAEQHRAVIVTPLFPAGISGPDDLDGYKEIGDGQLRYDQVLFAMLDEIAARWDLDVSRFYLAGHSGGGQFAARMLLLHPGRLAGVAISAPGRITLVDPAVSWPAGTADTEDRFGIRVDPAEVAKVPILLTAGAEDLGTADLQAQEDPAQESYGSTRIARLTTLAGHIRATGADVRLELVPGVGHSGNPTQPVVERFLAGLIRTTRTLGEVATIVRSKNAGPFWMTIDAFFANDADYRGACASALTDRRFLAATYAIDPDSIEIYRVDSLLALKISFPRPVPQGSPGDTDQHAGQQYVPLLGIPIPS